MSAKAPTPPPSRAQPADPKPLTDEERDRLAERLIDSIGPLLEKACSPNRIGFVISIGRDADNGSTASNLPFAQLKALLAGLVEGIDAADRKMKDRAAGMPSAQ